MRLVALSLVLVATMSACGSRATEMTANTERLAEARPTFVADDAAVAQAANQRELRRVVQAPYVAERDEMVPASSVASARDSALAAGVPAATPRAAGPAPAWTCPASAFCYSRLQIAGPIVPYTDCTGRTDVGLQIRSLECVNTNYLAGHGYTQFGRITAWRAGDIVFARGRRYVVYDGFTQSGCTKPARALAPLSLQTSLTPTMCGPILIVQARGS